MTLKVIDLPVLIFCEEKIYLAFIY